MIFIGSLAVLAIESFLPNFRVLTMISVSKLAQVTLIIALMNHPIDFILSFEPFEFLHFLLMVSGFLGLSKVYLLALLLLSLAYINDLFKLLLFSH